MTSVITEKIRQAPVDAARSSFGSSVVFQSMSLWSAGGVEGIGPVFFLF